MSVGHLAREIEKAGIPTVCVFVKAFQPIAESMGVPRVVITRHPLGRPLGPPGDRNRQRAVVEAALGLLASASAGGTLLELNEPYRV